MPFLLFSHYTAGFLKHQFTKHRLWESPDDITVFVPDEFPFIIIYIIQKKSHLLHMVKIMFHLIFRLFIQLPHRACQRRLSIEHG